MTLIQRSTHVYMDVEFSKGHELGIPDEKADSPISERLVTAFLPFVVIKSPPQGVFNRGKKLRQTLVDDDLLHLNTHDILAAAAEEVASE